MSGVFLSYSRADAALAEQVVRALRAIGVDVWWDQDMPGVDWQQELERQVTELSALVVIWTPASVNSEYVRDEARLALSRHKLVNVLHGLRAPPFPFDRINGLPIDDWNGRDSHGGWSRLVATIEEFLVSAGVAGDGDLTGALARRERVLHDAQASVAAAEEAFQQAKAREAESKEAAAAAKLAHDDAEAQFRRVAEMRVSTTVLHAAQAELDTGRAAMEAADNERRAAAAALSAASRAVARARNDLAQMFERPAPVHVDPHPAPPAQVPPLVDEFTPPVVPPPTQVVAPPPPPPPPEIIVAPPPITASPPPPPPVIVAPPPVAASPPPPPVAAPPPPPVAPPPPPPVAAPPPPPVAPPPPPPPVDPPPPVVAEPPLGPPQPATPPRPQPPLGPSDSASKPGSAAPLIFILTGIGAMISLVLVVALLSGHQAPPNDVNAAISNALTNLAVPDTNVPVPETNTVTAPATEAVFDPNGPNPLLARDPAAGSLDPATMNANAAAALQAGDVVTSAEWSALSASKGDAQGQARLGVAFALGKGVKEDDQAAFDMFQKSADQGNMEGEEWEGSYYQHGYGIPIDLTKARYWYEKSAAQGDSYAQDWLTKNPE